MKKITLALALLVGSLSVQARTDLFNVTFDTDWTDSFQTLELDGRAPHSAINAYFMNSAGVSQPWWPLKDTQNSKDRFMSSHSFYQSPAASNDWLVSRPIHVPTTGFTLKFEAQSLPIRSGDAHALSDLWVFITEQAVTPDWQPTPSEAAMFIQQVPIGADRDNAEGDFTPYELNLGPYAGKTVCISFANLNTDKDLLCLNNIEVYRPDAASMTCTAPQYAVAGDFDIHCSVIPTGQSLTDWTLTLRGNGLEQSTSGASLADGETLNHIFTAKVSPDAEASYTVTLSASGIQPIERTVRTTGLAFATTRHIMLEETTGTWCGNCPIGIYTIENLETEESLQGRFHPISIHVGNDPMVHDNYQYMFGVGATAPIMRVNRGQDVVMVGDVDFRYNSSNPSSAAAKIMSYLDHPALADIHLSAIYDSADSTRLHVTADILPAVTLDGSKYRVGYVLTENNVYNPELSARWRQDNYLSGDPLAGEENPFYHLPKKITGMRYHDVARELYDFHGQEGSVPARPLAPCDTVRLTRTLAIPTLASSSVPPIKRRNLYLTAFMIDSATDAVVNCTRIPLDPNPEPKYSLHDLLASSSIGEVAPDPFNAAPVYYNLQGQRIAAPDAPGVYIEMRGNKMSKILK